jgi:hypothetical protein
MAGRCQAPTTEDDRIVTEVDHATAIIRIARLEQDATVPEPGRGMSVEVRSADAGAHVDDESWSFAHSAELHVPSLLDLPLRTRGEFTELMIDLHGPIFPAHPDYLYEVDLMLRGNSIGTKTFRNYTQRHQYIVSTQLLFEDFNVLTLNARRISGDGEAPHFFVRLFYAQRDRLLRTLESNSIWLFSTARSGSTWLSQDLLCGARDVRPMDEPGIGRMFAPFDWASERMYNLPEISSYVESGLDYETGSRSRDNPDILPPFERAFIYAGRENQIGSAQNWNLYLDVLKETVFRHVLNEWGLLDYRNVVFKMPNESHAADVIMQAFPGSFMIFLMRDGRDVMKSRFSPFASATLAETTDPQLRLYAIAFWSHFWNFQVDIVHSAFLAHSPQRSLFVRYEDLRRDTIDELRVVFDRVGMSMADDELAELVSRTTLEHLPADQRGPDKPRQEGQIGNYASVFSPREIELMEAIMGPNLRRFGYELHTEAKPVENPPTVD